MTRIQLAYPKIPANDSAPAGRCVAFDKLDGTNLHWVWDSELGWYSFGTRRDRFDLDGRGIEDFGRNHPGLEEAAPLFLNTIATSLTENLLTHDGGKSEQVTVFTEFVGPGSFAGRHRESDPKELVLIDVQRGQTFLSPEEFLTDFSEFKLPRVVYRGRLTGKFVHEVREGKYDVVEGVVCKGVRDGQVWRVKIKTNQYMERLKAAFASDWERFWET